jgi:hypothetical protein
MSQKRSRSRPAPLATPAQSRRPVGPMPRATRPAAAPAGTGAGQRTVFGMPWPLPVSPWVVGLVALLLIAGGAAWAFEGRFETPPAQAAKRLLPYKTDDLDRVVLTSPAGSVTFTRDTSGKFSSAGPPPAPTPVPSPGAAPGPVVLAPSTKLEGSLGQMADITIDREVASEPSRSADFGLDAPQMTIEMTPKRAGGGAAIIAVGGANPDGSAYYVRREVPSGPKDTVLVTRYTLDDLMKVANELITGESATG